MMSTTSNNRHESFLLVSTAHGPVAEVVTVYEMLWTRQANALLQASPQLQQPLRPPTACQCQAALRGRPIIHKGACRGQVSAAPCSPGSHQPTSGTLAPNKSRPWRTWMPQTGWSLETGTSGWTSATSSKPPPGPLFLSVVHQIPHV